MIPIGRIPEPDGFLAAEIMSIFLGLPETSSDSRWTYGSENRKAGQTGKGDLRDS
jgi:hypothetical protein